MNSPTSNGLIEHELELLNKRLGDHFDADAIILRAPIRFGLDDTIRSEIESMRMDHKPRPKTLVVMIETTGGFIEVVERIYMVFRQYYDNVKFIVPNFSYSAGTVLVLSGDDIYMDYYSVLGPIDPQLENNNERFVSGLGYLAKFKELKTIINNATNPESVRAELAYLLKKFDPAELFDLEQARSHSSELLVSWLPKHKFKDWNQTETTKRPVTENDRKSRANEIAEILVDPERWHSHGRGIGLRELESEEIKLKIINFGNDPDLNPKIRNYYNLFIDYCRKIGAGSANVITLHSIKGFRRV